MPNIEDILKTCIQNNEANTFVVVVPTSTALLKRQRELIRYHENRAVSNLHVYTLADFVQRLYNQVRPSRRHISSGLQNLWLHEIANPNSDNTDAYRYNAFRPTQNTPIPDSTLSLISDTINNIRERGDTTPNFTADNPTEIDFDRFYKDYEAKLGNRWIDDSGKHLYLANEFKEEYVKYAFPRVKLVVVEGFNVLSKADIKLLKRIAGMPDIEMWFRTDCFSDNEHLYKNVTNLVKEFEDANVHIDSTYERKSDQHQYFSENLFRTNTASDDKKDLVDQIKVLKPADRSEEVEQIAQLIQKHVSEDNCQLEKICVAYYNVGQYQQRIAEIFPAYGIPYSLSENIPLTKSEVVKAIFNRLTSNRETIGDTYFTDAASSIPTRNFYPHEFQEHVDNLLNDGEVLQRILNPMLQKNRGIVEGEVDAYHHFKKIVKELCDILESEDKPYRYEDYISKLHNIARHTHYQSRASVKSETVKIVPLGELRSSEFGIVFLGNFIDGEFPQSYRPDPLLPETPYRTEEEQLHDNRFLFYRVLKSFRERLYLLVPKREGESELIPSIFQAQLEAIAEIEKDATITTAQLSPAGFLSAYSNYIWSTKNSVNGQFPNELKKMRPLIDNVVSVEKSREETHDKLAHEGILAAGQLSSESQTSLEKLRHVDYSVTDLEIYARCPFQYFVAKVLKSTVKTEEDEDELSSLEKGDLAHRVLCTFHTQLREQGDLPISRCSNEVFERTKEQLDDVLNFHAEEKRSNNRSDTTKNNLFWVTSVDKLRTALHKWLEAERTDDLHVMPRFFEVSIGPTDKPGDPELRCPNPIPIGDVYIKGRIDRIDIGEGSFNIVDYKTGGSTIRIRDILEGRSLQLPIYLQIAKKLLDEKGKSELEPVSGLYHKIRLDECTVELGIGMESFNDIIFKSYKDTVWKKVAKSGQLLEDELFDKLLARVKGYVEQYVDSIANGDFPLITRVQTFVSSEEEGDTPIAPKNETESCNYCTYKRICRVRAFAETPKTD